jgi:hypothetical protein
MVSSFVPDTVERFETRLPATNVIWCRIPCIPEANALVETTADQRKTIKHDLY